MARCRLTLIEVMVAVAIVSILAAIAVPMLHDATLRARHAEVPNLLVGIADAQIAYEAVHGEFVQAVLWTPPLPMGAHRRPWPSGTPYDVLGFAPDGSVYGAYSVQSPGEGLVQGRGGTDLDEDGAIGAWFFERDRDSCVRLHVYGVGGDY